MMGRPSARLFFVCALAVLAGCSQAVRGIDAGSDDAGLDPVWVRDNGAIDRTPVDASDASDAPDDGVTSAADVAANTCEPIPCLGHVLACGDCLDNDGDGVADQHDPECLGVCDDTEEPGLLSATGGVPIHCTADCYFDFGDWADNDDCRWDHRCDPEAPEAQTCAYEASRVGSASCPAVQSNMCHDFCRPLTPNGCDCFGCCTFPELASAGPGGTPAYVWLGSKDGTGTGSCTLAAVADPAACHRCTPVADCFNECGPCEVCIGRPVPPAGCGADTQCATGVQSCGLSNQPDCPFGTYCVTGCCQPVPR